MHYTPPKWLKGSHAQTIWPLIIKHRGATGLLRERWDTPDGDFIDVDFLPFHPKKPFVILFHGLEGSSRSHYARALMKTLRLRGWNGAVVHSRSCSGEPNKLLRAYHSGDSEEIHWILQRFAERYPDLPRYAVGISLGGNMLICWLGRYGALTPKLISKAAAISAPLDLSAADASLTRGFGRIYIWNFLRTMHRTVANKARLYPGTFDIERAVHARTMAEFDNAYTAPVHGFHDVHDYWARSSSKPLLKKIIVPTLVLNAQNDPFLPAECLPSPNEVSMAVTLEQPEQGGHAGFVTGSFPGHVDWLPRRLLRFFDDV